MTFRKKVFDFLTTPGGRGFKTGQNIGLHCVLQEVFHVYLNTFEIAVSHLFLIILSNIKLTLIN